MPFKWSKLSLRRLYGLDLKTNVMDVSDGYSLDLENVFQNGLGVISKRNGGKPFFSYDADHEIAEIGSATIGTTKYYFRFVNGDFQYSTALGGIPTVLSPSPEIDTDNEIWWSVVNDAVYFVDGTNVLRYFNGTAIVDSQINVRPTAAPTGSGGTGFDFVYTTDNGQGESPSSPALVDDGSTATITVPLAQIETGDKIRIYSRATTIAATSLNVTGTSGGSNVTYGSDAGGNFALVTSGASNAVITTVAIVDGLPQLYTELGLAINKSAPTGLTGISTHYGRLVGWKGDFVFNSKITNANAWPDDTAQNEAFVYGVERGNGEDIAVCVSFLESLYVMKMSHVIVFGGIGPDDTGNNAYSFRRLEANQNGCIAGKSAHVIEGNLVYLSRNGFYATNGTKPDRIGEKIEPEIQALSEANLQNAAGFYHQKDGIYICSVGPSNNRQTYALDVRKDNDKLVGWFKWQGIPARSYFYDEDQYLAGLYTGMSIYETTTTGSLRFSDPSKETITDSGVNTGTDVLTVTKDYATSTPIDFRTAGTAPTGLVADTTYYAIRISATQIQLATTEANAAAGIEIDITAAGSGNFYLISQVAFQAYYTTNWLNFENPSYVKKLGKLGLLFDVSSSNISIAVSAAYDWGSAFQSQGSVVISSNHAWGTSSWGVFAWAQGAIGSPKNVAISRRKVRAIRYRFSNSSANSDFNLLGIEQNFDILRNRGNFS